MKTKFQVEDKIVAYWEDGDVGVRTVGVLLHIDYPRIMMEVRDDGCEGAYFKAGDTVHWHVRQCRKIVPSKRNYIWIKTYGPLSCIGGRLEQLVRLDIAPEPTEPGWIKFRQVK